MSQVEAKLITLKAFGVQLGISYRQGRRILAHIGRALGCGSDTWKYRQCISEKDRGSNPVKSSGAYRTRYSDFVPTFAAEKLAEIEGITVSVETLRKCLLGEGLWQRHRKTKEHRSRRDRRPCFGDLVQFDEHQRSWCAILNGIPEPKNNFGKACEKLGIVRKLRFRVIVANSLSEQKGAWNAITECIRIA